MQLNVILAFLIGSIPTGYLLNKYFGHGDIRKVGSGNIGATNVLRHSGKLLGLLTLLIDVSKGFLAVVWLDRISVKGSSFVVDGEVVIFVIGSSVVLGHIFSPWLKFKGGKGVATMLGVILYISHSCYKSCSSIDMYYFLDFRNNNFFVSIFSWLMMVADNFLEKYRQVPGF